MSPLGCAGPDGWCPKCSDELADWMVGIKHLGILVEYAFTGAPVLEARVEQPESESSREYALLLAVHRVREAVHRHCHLHAIDSVFS
jgi:hypothetical protein